MLPILNLYEMTLNNIPYVLHEHSLTFEMLPQLWSYARPELIFVTNITNYIHGEKNCHVEKFQLSMYEN